MLPLALLTTGILVVNCATGIQQEASLPRPQRPQIASADELREAALNNDITSLVKIYVRDIAELTSYARKLEALLDATEGQRERER